MFRSLRRVKGVLVLTTLLPTRPTQPRHEHGGRGRNPQGRLCRRRAVVDGRPAFASYGKAGGPWSNDTVTNIYFSRLRTNLSLTQPTGAWTNAFDYDAAKRPTNGFFAVFSGIQLLVSDGSTGKKLVEVTAFIPAFSPRRRSIRSSLLLASRRWMGRVAYA